MRDLFNWIRRKFNFNFGKPDKVIEAHSDLLKKIENFLGFQISHPEYFVKALTHRSYLELSPDIIKSNERLEFLGDSVLGLVVAEFLFSNFSEEDEGYLTKTRSHFVNRDALANAAEKMKLQRFILYDKRFLKGSHEGMRTIMADALEAVIGAIYLDAGLKKAEDFVRKRVIHPSFKSGGFMVDKNYKGQLLEFTHAEKMETPSYKTISEEGPDHDKNFIVNVLIGSEVVGTGEGKNKKSAEQDAAKKALEIITNKHS